MTKYTDTQKREATSSTHCSCGRLWLVTKPIKTDYGKPVSGYWCPICDNVKDR